MLPVKLVYASVKVLSKVVATVLKKIGCFESCRKKSILAVRILYFEPLSVFTFITEVFANTNLDRTIEERSLVA